MVSPTPRDHNWSTLLENTPKQVSPNADKIGFEISFSKIVPYLFLCQTFISIVAPIYLRGSWLDQSWFNTIWRFFRTILQLFLSNGFLKSRFLVGNVCIIKVILKLFSPWKCVYRSVWQTWIISHSLRWDNKNVLQQRKENIKAMKYF